MSLNYEREAENRKLRESRENRTASPTAQRFSSTLDYTDQRYWVSKNLGRAMSSFYLQVV